MRKTFDELYDEIFKEYKEANDKAVKKLRLEYIESSFRLYVLGMFIAIAIGILLDISFKSNFITIVIVLIGVIFYLLSILFVQEKDFNKFFAKNVISKMINNLGYDLKYTKEGSISKEDFNPLKPYYLATYKRSDNLIKGKLDNEKDFTSAMVTLTSKDGDSTYVHNNFSQIVLPKSINANICLRYNDILFQHSDKRIEIESEEFEEMFDLLSTDKQVAAKLFTPEVIAEFMKIIYCPAITAFRLLIDNDKLIGFFEIPFDYYSPSNVNPLDRKNLSQIYNIISFNIDFFNTLGDKIISNLD